MSMPLPARREPCWVHLGKRAMVAKVQRVDMTAEDPDTWNGAQEAFEVWTSPNGVGWEMESCHETVDKAVTYADYVVLNQIGCHPKALPLLKSCGCGRQYDLATWYSLPLAGHHLGSYESPEAEDDDPSLEMRTCVCKSTLSVEQRKL